MLFLRSPGGISHHPDEQVREEDVAAALEVGVHMLTHLPPGLAGPALGAPATVARPALRARPDGDPDRA